MFSHTSSDRHTHTHQHSTVHPLPTEHIIQLNNNSDIYSQAPQEARFLVTKPALPAHTELWVTSTITAVGERGQLFRSLTGSTTLVWILTSKTLQSLGNNNRGLAFDVSSVIKVETRLEINRSSLKGTDPLPVARRLRMCHPLMDDCCYKKKLRQGCGKKEWLLTGCSL